MVLAVAPEAVDGVLRAAADAGVPAAEIGVAGGDRLHAAGAFAVALHDAHRAWSSGIPAALGL